ncbi:MAG: tetratricopeptide repeat protein [bacterium]|nr:tetratricopeptide repeat protein [bacterium]
MNAHRIPGLTRCLLSSLLGLAVTIAVAADSTGELLEKGIYTEETVGDLSAAIEIYTRVVEDAEANRPHVAQAQFRLGMIHLKRGDDAAARAAFESVVRDYPEQEALVAEAQQRLAAFRSTLDLLPAPWEDGEYLQYNVAMPTGKVIGAVFTVAHSTEVDGIEAWLLELRKMVMSAATNQGVSQVYVDRETLHPIRSSMRHGLMGSADAVYGPDRVEVKNSQMDINIDTDNVVFDNEQTLHLFRTLPLAPGYRATLSVLPTWVGIELGVEVEVTGIETCTVPAGEFECYATSISVGPTLQKLWFSTDSDRYLLRQEGGGVKLELAEIGRITPDRPASYAIEDFGVSGTLPEAWVGYVHRLPQKPDTVIVRAGDPDAVAVNVIEIDRCPHGECPDLERTARRELEGAQRRFEDYTMREGSWTETNLGGRRTIGFVGDYLQDGKPWVQYRMYSFAGDLRLEFIFRSPVERFEQLRAAMDAVADNLRAE